MPKTIKISLFDNNSLNDAIKEVKRYKEWVGRKENELRVRLASVGALVASIRFSRAVYNGTNDVSVRVEDSGKTATIYADGDSVAFIEFGSGATYGYGHPEAEKFGAGPGTYPDGKGHWNSPDGWWYAHGEHSYGNPPAMAMYDAREEIVNQYMRIAREVFGSD